MSTNSSSNVSSLSDDCAIISTPINAIKVILLLPFSIIILTLGVQKWRQQRSLATATHSDFLAYHQAAMELIWVIGWFFFLSSVVLHVAALENMGLNLCVVVFYGEILFNVLTCAERYLAVVHPVVYMGLKNRHGVRIRNVLTGCVWALCFVLMSMHTFLIGHNFTGLFCFFTVSLIVTCYCSVSVHCVLNRPGPGDGTRDGGQVGHSKRRAFYTIMVISTTMCFSFVGNFVAFALGVEMQKLEKNDVFCYLMSTVFVFNLPSCLVLPLLYLHRAGKLTCSCCSRE